MKCGECVTAGLTSRLYSGGAIRTLLGFRPYYDEEGRYHSHDPNKVVIDYECSNGHKFTATSKTPCPCLGCGYGHEPAVLVPS